MFLYLCKAALRKYPLSKELYKYIELQIWRFDLFGLLLSIEMLSFKYVYIMFKDYKFTEDLFMY